MSRNQPRLASWPSKEPCTPPTAMVTLLVDEALRYELGALTLMAVRAKELFGGSAARVMPSSS